MMEDSISNNKIIKNNEIFEISEWLQNDINDIKNNYINDKIEYDKIKLEVATLKEKKSSIQFEIDKITNDLLELEESLSKKISKIDKFKGEQKMFLNCFNDEMFNFFMGMLNKLDKELKEIILLFLNYEKCEDILYILLETKEDLMQILKNSYKYLETLLNSDSIKFEKIKNKILNNLNGFKASNIIYPFNIIISYILNTIEIFNLKNETKLIKVKIDKKILIKGNFFLRFKLIQEKLKNKEYEIKLLTSYIRGVENISIIYNNLSPKTIKLDNVKKIVTLNDKKQESQIKVIRLDKSKDNNNSTNNDPNHSSTEISELPNDMSERINRPINQITKIKVKTRNKSNSVDKIYKVYKSQEINVLKLSNLNNIYNDYNDIKNYKEIYMNKNINIKNNKTILTSSVSKLHSQKNIINLDLNSKKMKNDIKSFLQEQRSHNPVFQKFITPSIKK